MRVGFNPYISTPKNKKQQSTVSFQASAPKKIYSSKIFELEKALEAISLQFEREKYLAKLKEFAHININSRNFDGDTLITDSAKKGSRFLCELMELEKRGEIEGINWNATDQNEDNIIMIALKGTGSGRVAGFTNIMYGIKELAEAGKIDVNYVNEEEGYSLMDCALKYAGTDLFSILELKGLDAAKTCSDKPIIIQAIDRGIPTASFNSLVCHPSIDINKYNPKELVQYIGNAPSYEERYKEPDKNFLDNNTRVQYIKSINNALKLQIARQTSKYYQDNGMLDLNQIGNFVNTLDYIDAINMPLNDIGENIGHFLAETYIYPDDKAGIAKVKSIIKKLRENLFSFWKEDDIGRTPLMIALEAENLVVAKMLMERMTKWEFKYINGCSIPYYFSIHTRGVNHEPAIRELINKLKPKDKEEFTRLFEKRLNSEW